MRIRIENDAVSTWVAGHPDYAERTWTPAQNIGYTGISEVTPQTGAGWQARKFFDGGNEALIFTFSVTREFTSPRLCTEWIHSHFSGTKPHPRTGDIYLILEDDTGTREDVLLSAVLVTLSARYIGANSAQVNYEIRGGLFGVAELADFGYLLNDDGTPLLNDDGTVLLLD
jgi:hypothetical protein